MTLSTAQDVVQCRWRADAGWREAVEAYVTHGVAVRPNAVERVDGVAARQPGGDGFHRSHRRRGGAKKVKILSIAPLMAEAVVRISQERSVSSLFG